MIVGDNNVWRNFPLDTEYLQLGTATQRGYIAAPASQKRFHPGQNIGVVVDTKHIKAGEARRTLHARAACNLFHRSRCCADWNAQRENAAFPWC
ncbi:hypothetical protein D3C81_1708540 [compost metagenome]